MSVKWDGQLGDKDYLEGLRQLHAEDQRRPSRSLNEWNTDPPYPLPPPLPHDWQAYEVAGATTPEPVMLRRAPTDSPDGLAGYPEREAAARDEWARLARHRELAETMLAAAELEPWAALRGWTADALAMVDVLPDNWLPSQNEAEWARLQLLVRAIFGLVGSGKLEPTRRSFNAWLAAEVREAKMAAERW